MVEPSSIYACVNLEGIFGPVESTRTCVLQILNEHLFSSEDGPGSLKDHWKAVGFLVCLLFISHLSLVPSS